MSEKIPYQPSPEAFGKDAWLKELNSKKTREIILSYLLKMKLGLSPENAEDITQQTMLKALNYETQNPHFFKGNQTRLTNSEFFVVSRLSHN